MRLRLPAVALLVLAALPSPAVAATVATTAPMLGTELTSGRVRCLAVNVDTKPRTLVSMELVATSGQVLHAISGPVTATPGTIQLTDFSSLDAQSPAFCRFVYQGKFRASLMYYNGAELEVIPATTK